MSDLSVSWSFRRGQKNLLRIVSFDKEKQRSKKLPFDVKFRVAEQNLIKKRHAPKLDPRLDKSGQTRIIISVEKL